MQAGPWTASSQVTRRHNGCLVGPSASSGVKPFFSRATFHFRLQYESLYISGRIPINTVWADIRNVAGRIAMVSLWTFGGPRFLTSRAAFGPGAALLTPPHLEWTDFNRSTYKQHLSNWARCQIKQVCQIVNFRLLLRAQNDQPANCSPADSLHR